MQAPAGGARRDLSRRKWSLGYCADFRVPAIEIFLTVLRAVTNAEVTLLSAMIEASYSSGLTFVFARP
jgi:hypothetical protein